MMTAIDQPRVRFGGSRPEDCLASGGELGAIMRAMRWADSPLGPVSRWPQSLRTAVGICLTSRFPMLLLWGPELRLLYNDAYRPMLGDAHPGALATRPPPRRFSRHARAAVTATSAGVSSTAPSSTRARCS